MYVCAAAALLLVKDFERLITFSNHGVPNST